MLVTLTGKLSSLRCCHSTPASYRTWGFFRRHENHSEETISNDSNTIHSPPDGPERTPCINQTSRPCGSSSSR